jgi:hypothetical protein
MGMDITPQRKREAAGIVFGARPTDVASAFRWLDAALAWYGHAFEGDDSTGEPLTLVTLFHWDTRGEDVRPTLSRTCSRVYDVNCEAAFTIIDQQHDDAYATAMDVQPCAHCGRLVQWRDDCGWRHMDHTVAGCFLIPEEWGWEGWA